MTQAGILDAYTEAKKKRGRPPKVGMDRHACGKIKREPQLTEKEMQRNMATATDARMRHTGAKAKEAQSQEAGYALGRLYLKGLLDTNPEKAAQMLDAGNRMGLDFDSYYRLTGIPSPNPRAMDMRKVRGLGGDPSVDDVRKATNRMMAIEGALGCVDRDGKPVMSLCKRIILLDEDAMSWTPFMLGHLRRGLRALVAHYGLERG